MCSAMEKEFSQKIEPKVDLGFLDTPPNSWCLKRYYFPSKVGGKPAWLDPKHLPSIETLTCPNCCQPMSFLLQVYSPDDSSSETFHRTIFVFCCKNGSCYKQEDNQPVKVLRCNLPRKNDYYSENPPDYDQPYEEENDVDVAPLCHICGCSGRKICSRCKSVNYCSKDHQKIHWKFHKSKCCKDGTVGINDIENESNFLFPESEILIESEDLSVKKERGVSEKTVITEMPIDDASSFSETELNDFVEPPKEDKQFLKFKRKILKEPDQIIRYEKVGKPLWCSRSFSPEPEDIPSCICGAKRSFEFQVMPHLLSHLNVDTSISDATIDWGTIAIYTCSCGCRPDSSLCSSAYVTEFAWKQNYTKSI